jgi:hypothetical protein
VSKSDSAKARQHRLALKLRENLRRRKGKTASADAQAATRRDDKTDRER